MYNDEDIIMTNIDEIMTFSESKKYCASVQRIATEEEAIEYQKEEDYWRKQSEDENHSGSYHEID